MSPSERALLSFPFFTGFSSFSASSSGGTSTRLSLEFFCYSFSHIEQYHFECTLQKNLLPCQLCSPTRTSFPQLSCPDKCNELYNNSQCDDICNSKACAYDNLDCNEKLPKLVSLFLRCTPQKKPSAMPIVQPHQIKFRVFLLIAQLMVRKLFLGAHFKMPFC